MNNSIISVSKDNNIKNIHERILSCHNNTNKILIFLNDYLSKRNNEEIIFNYCNEINLKNCNKKVLLGKMIKYDFKENVITIIYHREYNPYYNETKIIEKYKFKDIGFTDLLDMDIIKFLGYSNKKQKKIDGVYNFPKYSIAKLKETKEKNKICEELNITNEYYDQKKYNEIIRKYSFLLSKLYNAIKE